MADAVMDSFALFNRNNIYPGVAEVTKSDEINRLSCQVAELTKRLDDFILNANSRARSRNRPNSRTRPTNRLNSQPERGICYYHQRFGQNANRCHPPCSFGTTHQVEHAQPPHTA